MRNLLLTAICLAAVLSATFSPNLARAAEISARLPITAVRISKPIVAEASDEALANMKTFSIPPGFKIELVAAEPMLANPVAFCIDWKGRFLVSETHRYRSSVLDIRHYMFMLEDDLAIRTPADRIAMTKKHFGSAAAELAVESELVRLVEDTDGDHKADKSTIYADRFNTQLDGIASGVLARKDKVYFTNIPHLWELSDLDNDGRADLRKSLSYGYGVRFSYTGHDMHGLAIGPDGKLYFSFGDRGANVRTQEGGVLAFPDEGAVFRCNLDGSQMEVVHSGLRNPQELAFDDFGNLFTGDNDCDNGDSERWVHVVEGGESGWRVGYQHAPLGKAGQWMSEKLWVPRFPGQAAYILPPVANIMDGPSGLTSNPGTGFPEKYAGQFFLTHFKGQASVSGISAIKLKPKGASFELTSQEKFIWNCLPTDVDFGYDGSMYFTDWHHDWPKSSRGRIYRVYDPEAVQMKPVREVKTIFAEGFDHRSLDELSGLLAHKDRRVRMEAQFAIVDQAFETIRNNSAPNRARREINRLAQVARRSPRQLARLHGIWGLGQIAARHSGELKAIVKLLADKDAEVRAQTAKVLGDAGYANANKKLISRLGDASPRVRFFAAQSLGKLKAQEAAAPIVEMIRKNADNDLYLRHAGVMALVRINNAESLAAAAGDADASVRMAALLAMRRLKEEKISLFLNDEDPLLVLEAARAINDVPIESAMPQLAALAGDISRVRFLKQPPGVETDLRTPLILRIVNANFRVGTESNATALADLAMRDHTPDEGCIEALQALSSWAEPHARDRIVGVYRPLPKRNPSVAVNALAIRFDNILRGSPNGVKLSAIKAAGILEIQRAAPRIMQLALNTSAAPNLRAESLHALKKLDKSRLALAVEKAINSDSEILRKTAVSYLGVLSKNNALTALKTILAKGSVGEKQSAFEVLGTLEGAEAEAMIREWLDRLLAGKSNAALELDIVEAAEKRTEASVQKKLQAYLASAPQGDEVAPFRAALHGGDATAGEKVFLEKVEVACIRCHKLDGKGGDVGPIQDGIGARHPRKYLLESIVAPSARIAEGFASVSVELKNGDEFNGTVKSETGAELVLNLTDGSATKIKKSDIQFRQTSSLSGMPPGMGQLLSKRELRDLIEFLANLK